MAKVDEAIEELTDEVSAINSKYEGLSKDVADIKKSLSVMEKAAQKPIPVPTLEQSVVNTVVSNAVGEYFRLHPVGKTFTDEDKENLVELIYSKFNEATTMQKDVRNLMRTGIRNDRRSGKFKALKPMSKLRNRLLNFLKIYVSGCVISGNGQLEIAQNLSLPRRN